jgi:hypothetical protein
MKVSTLKRTAHKENAGGELEVKTTWELHPKYLKIFEGEPIGNLVLQRQLAI